MFRAVVFVILAYCLVFPVPAEEMSLQQKLTDVRQQIEEEEVINAELRAELATRETRVSELKLKLKELEDRIAALKEEHNIPQADDW